MKNIAKNDKVVVVMTVLSVLALMSVVAMPVVATSGDVAAVACYQGLLPPDICDPLNDTVFSLIDLAVWTGVMSLLNIAGVGVLAIGL